MAQASIESNFTSMHPTVEFLDILDFYLFDTDLHCKYEFNDYTPQEGDRVAIFKIGWSLVKDYVVFEWAPIATKDKACSVIFNRHILPKNSTEVYQICYISNEHELHGASTPFQFHSGENPMVTSTIMPSNVVDGMVRSQLLTEQQKDQEIVRLREENGLLKESLKVILFQNNNGSIKNYDNDIKELKDLTQSLKSMSELHQKELDLLKIKITEGGDEYRKLYLEKVKVERKYEKLKGKRNERQSIDEEMQPVNDPNFDIGDLKSMPPFPSLLK